jgi:curved DNA-binding protein
VTAIPDDALVNVSVGEAVLGGRVEVDTPGGKVRVTIPAGTSSGTRLRLKGKGTPDSLGVSTDLFVSVRIVVPKDLDAESRRLIEEFARLNPTTDQAP